MQELANTSPVNYFIYNSLLNCMDTGLHYTLSTSSSSSSSSSMALQLGVGPGLHYNTSPNLWIPCSISPFVYSHLSQVRRHIIQPSGCLKSAARIAENGNILAARWIWKGGQGSGRNSVLAQLRHLSGSTEKCTQRSIELPVQRLKLYPGIHQTRTYLLSLVCVVSDGVVSISSMQFITFLYM
jgi:hypothetical protein